jgi:hypothetical protein
MSSKINEIHYTICPVGNASFIAAHKGWLKEGLAPLGVEPVLLQTLPREFWKAHDVHRIHAEQGFAAALASLCKTFGYSKSPGYRQISDAF